jgi:chromatin remodeling complex protein RSC6
MAKDRLFTKLRPDPTIDEVLLSLWHYIQTKGLLDKKNINCDELLKHLFGAETLPIYSLRQKVLESILLPAKPITIEYSLTPQSFVTPPPGAKR